MMVWARLGADICGATERGLIMRDPLGAKKSTQTFFVQSFSTTLRVMDVRAENRGRPHQKVRFPAAPVVGRNFLTLGHPGVRVRNVRGKSGPKSLCLCCFFFPDPLTPFPEEPKRAPKCLGSKNQKLVMC